MKARYSDMFDPSLRRLPATTLLEFAHALLTASGLPSDRAQDVAEVLLEGDLLGHTTHGLALLPRYLQDIRAGRMAVAGEPRVVADHGAALTWDGGYLPGPWLVRRAVDEARARLVKHPMSTVVIGRSHHIACLQAFLKPTVDDGFFIVLACSDPNARWVAPAGSVQPVYSPNPIAAGIPTEGDPILIDISASTTAAAVCVRTAQAGGRLPGPWLIDANGHPSDDPRPLVEDKSGALYPLGGADLGYKGFALGLLLEALTSALAGHGRHVQEARWGCSVFLTLIDPAGFGGRAAFARETSFVAAASRAAAVAPGQPAVRLPGERALLRRADQLANGVALHSDILPALLACAADQHVDVPSILKG
jgi:LDH2 family malate/lactate/ureidoglycolate dehydrogenase